MRKYGEDSEENEENLKDLIRSIVDDKSRKELEDSKKIKKFKMPRMFKLSGINLKKNFITVILVKNNRSIDFLKLPIEDGTVTIDGVPRVATTNYVLTYKGKPCIVLFEWGLEPLLVSKIYEKAVEDKMTTAARKLILAKMKLETLQPKKGFNIGIWGWFILLLIIGGIAYYFFKGGKLF